MMGQGFLVVDATGSRDARTHRRELSMRALVEGLLNHVCKRASRSLYADALDVCARTRQADGLIVVRVGGQQLGL
jgi:hypothetical protein